MGNHECLCNTKSSTYLNKGKRSLALDQIVQAFQDTEKPLTKSQVQLKITRLRNSYGVENNKAEKSKTSGDDLDFVYAPTWKYFDSLELLKDNLEKTIWMTMAHHYGTHQFIIVIILLLLSLPGRW